MTNLIIIKLSTLISRKNASQNVKKVVEKLKEVNNIRIDFHFKDYHPWGNCQILDEERQKFKVKRIFFQHGKRLTCQMHHHISEHWLVFKGTTSVTIDDFK